jgi:hypothetical protein
MQNPHAHYINPHAHFVNPRAHYINPHAHLCKSSKPLCYGMCQVQAISKAVQHVSQYIFVPYFEECSLTCELRVHILGTSWNNSYFMFCRFVLAIRGRAINPKSWRGTAFFLYAKFPTVAKNLKNFVTNPIIFWIFSPQFEKKIKKKKITRLLYVVQICSQKYIKDF